MPDSMPIDDTIEQWLSVSGQSIGPSETLAPVLGGDDWRVTMESLGLSQGGSNTQKFKLFEAIGKGGMATVHRGQQQSLGREIAIKVQREDVAHNAINAMLHEAWLTGALEHPNIVPMYDLVLDSEGRPLVLMRIIRGKSWGSFFDDDQRVCEKFSVENAREWHLRVFLQVCNALEFAHSRGVIHRDIKPENIMIGDHGQVYLLDWGIARATCGPLAEKLRGLATDAFAGTPCYLAPEMLLGGPESIDERTDVYLLGASLFHALTGQPPHPGTTIREVLDAVANAPVAVPSSLPVELRRLLNGCLDQDPEERPQSVRELRLSIEQFLLHRSSNKLCDAGAESLEALRNALAIGSLGEQDERTKLYDTYHSARSSLLAALRLWVGNEVAQQQLDEATTLMVEAELAHHAPRAASVLLANFEEAPKGLVRRVEAALLLDREDYARLQEQAAETEKRSSKHGAKSRALIIVLFGAIYGLLPTLKPMTAFSDLFLSDAIGLGACAGWALLMRSQRWGIEKGYRSEFNLRALAILTLIFTVLLGRHLALHDLGRPIPLVLAEDSLVMLMAAVVATIALDRRLSPIPLVYGLRHLFLLRYPEYYAASSAVSHTTLGLFLAYIWWPRESSAELSGPSSPSGLLALSSDKH